MVLCHNNLESYYRTNFALAQHHKYSITEIENLIVYERDLYVEMIASYLESLKKDQ